MFAHIFSEKKKRLVKVERWHFLMARNRQSKLSEREQRKHGNKKPMIRSNWAKKKNKFKKNTQKKKREEKKLSSCSQTCMMEQRRFSKESKLVPAYTQQPHDRQLLMLTHISVELNFPS